MVRRNEWTGGAGGAGEAAIKGGEGAVEGLREGYVPSVVGCQVVAQCPYPLGKWGEGEQFHIKTQQVIVRFVGVRPRNLTCLLQPPQDVGCFGQHQFRGNESVLTDYRLRPEAVGADVSECGNQYGGVDDCSHLRSWSRANRISVDDMRVPDAAFRSRTFWSHMSTEGREAMRSNSLRRNSCID